MLDKNLYKKMKFKLRKRLHREEEPIFTKSPMKKDISVRKSVVGVNSDDGRNEGEITTGSKCISDTWTSRRIVFQQLNRTNVNLCKRD
jgi:hypothetical protein